MNNQFKNQLQEYTNELNKVSDFIRNAESDLRESRIYIPFSLDISVDKDRIIAMAWEEDKRSSRPAYRLFLVSTEINSENSVPVYIPARRPFLECNSQDRLRYIQHLPEFLSAFGNFISEKTAQCKQVLSSITVVHTSEPDYSYESVMRDRFKPHKKVQVYKGRAKEETIPF